MASGSGPVFAGRMLMSGRHWRRQEGFRMSYRMYCNVQYGLGAHGALRPLFPGKSYDNGVQEKDPGNDLQCAPCAPKNPGALAGTAA